jgi:osmotically-inducible protein OsmY
MRAMSRTLAAVAIATTIAMTGCAAKQVVAVRDDSAITKDVQDRISADPASSKSNITVDTKAGVVSLSGEVSEGVRASAERIARDTPGVRSVDNNMRFGGSSAPAN